MPEGSGVQRSGEADRSTFPNRECRLRGLKLHVGRKPLLSRLDLRVRDGKSLPLRNIFGSEMRKQSQNAVSGGEPIDRLFVSRI